MNDDAALVAAALAGGPEAFAPIVERYRDAAFGVALARLRNFHDAEDVTQAAFIEAYERLGNLKDPARLGAWLRSITIHRCIDHLRRRVNVTGVEEIDDRLSDPATPHTEMERQELRDRIMAAIGRLNRPMAETTVLFYINGYSQEEIARIQEVPVGTVKRRLHDARNRLKEEMMDVAEDVLKKNAPKEDLSERVFNLLCRYDRTGQRGKAAWEATHFLPSGKTLSIEDGKEIYRIGMEGIEGFVQAMKVPHARTRRFALGMMKVMDSVIPRGTKQKEMLINLLIQATRDENRKVRMWSAERLFHLDVDEDRKRREFVPAVIPLLRDPTPRVRRRAAWKLEQWAAGVPLEVAALALAEEKDAQARDGMAQLVKAVISAQKPPKAAL